jgi:pectate lyase
MIRFLLTCIFLAATALPLAADARDYLKKSEDWFRSAEGRQRLDNLLSHQDKDGCWPKNIDTTAELYRGNQEELEGTFDNSATVHELRLLARAYRATDDNKYKVALHRGIECILDAQYTNGGWPQRPGARGYSQHITFNDGAMVGIMTLLREIASNDDDDFVSKNTRERASDAFDRGVRCILDCQIQVDGRLTVWCAQHDRNTLEPRGARSYEHPSLSGGESARIVCLLMGLDDPPDEIRRSIRAAVEWYRESRITGIRFVKVDGDRKVVRDPSAPPLWARFYEIESNRPIFSGRDGVIKYDVSEIEAERRNGYSWYGSAGEQVEACWSNWKWK